jgi:Carboxypeptidase regulatory-like domain/TonB-dependent Receptor Plug Domain
MYFKFFAPVYAYALACLIGIGCSLGAVGQSTTGAVSGLIKDNNGAVVSDAVITIMNPATNFSRTIRTNSEGVFSAPQLPPGNYTITVEKNGFKKIEKKDVILNAAAFLNAGEFTLEVGQVSETVTVTAAAAQLEIQSESGERSGLVTSEQLTNVAINGRNSFNYMKTLPGISVGANGLNFGQTSDSSGSLGSFTVNGTRTNQKEVTVDGSSNIDTGSNGGTHASLNPDAIAEIKVLTSNFQAEYGRAGGAFIAFVTKGGTNEFHGGGRYFHRHEGLNANNYFRNAQGRNAQGVEIQPRNLYRYNYVGYDIGGPIWIPGVGFNKDKDKLFFYWNQEFYRQLIPQGARNIRVPSALERSGDFSQTVDGNGARIFIRDPQKTGACNAGDQTACFPDNKIPQNRWYSNGQAILNVYPTPNVGGRNDFNYTSATSYPYPRREETLRIDYQINEKHRLTGRYTNNKDEQRLAYGTFISDYNFPLTRMIFPRPGRNGVLQLTSTLSPTLTNEFIFGPSSNFLNIEAEDDGALRSGRKIETPLLFPVSQGYIPNFRHGGIPGVAGTPTSNFNGLPFANQNHTFNFVDNVSKVIGVHTMKAGFYAQRSRKDQTVFAPIQSNIDFANDANNPLNTGYPFSNALLGVYNTYQQANNFVKGLYRYWNVEWYLQDNWKVSRRLTLDYGMRWSIYQPQYDERLQTGVFNPTLFDPARRVALYTPICLPNTAPCSGANRRAVDPRQVTPGFVPTLQNTLPGNFIALLVPNVGVVDNGIGKARDGYARGGFDDRGVHWGPRLGFAYDVFGTGRTVVRGGAGISYDRVQGNLTFGQLADIRPGSGGTLGPLAANGYHKDGFLPTIYSMSLGVQQDVGLGVVVDASYVGTLSRYLSQARNLNAIPYGFTFTRAAQDPTQFPGGVVPESDPNIAQVYKDAGLRFDGAKALPVQFLRPFPGYNDISFREFTGTANYHSLQLTASRKLSRGLFVSAAYTWSKWLTTANGDTDFTNPFNVRLYDYRLANFDRRHTFVTSYVYDLPQFAKYLGDSWLAKGVFNGWQVSGITSFATGTPFELGVTIVGINGGQRITGSYTEGPRFTLKGNPRLGPNGLQINADSFRLPSIGSVGLGERNFMTNPGFNNTDLSVFKNFGLGGDSRRNLQLRLEMFNAFNHTQFQGVNNGTQLAVPNGTNAAGVPQFITGGGVFARYGDAIVTNNLRSQQSQANQSGRPLGTYFGEYNSAADPRIIQLAVRITF